MPETALTPTLADLATAAESVGATATTDASGTMRRRHGATADEESARFEVGAGRVAGGARGNEQPAAGAAVPAPQVNASATAATANAAGDASGGSAKGGQTIGLGAGLGDGKTANAPASPMTPQRSRTRRLRPSWCSLTTARPPTSKPPTRPRTQARCRAASANSAASNVQGTLASATSAAIAPHVGSSGWDDAFSQKVVFLSNAHTQSAELTLNPKDLGPLQVALQVADNHAHALFVSQHAQVREAVEAALPKLREAMEANGIGLGSTSVSDGFARHSGQSEQQAGRDSGRGGRDAGGGGIGDAGGIGGVAVTASVPLRRTVGLVDTFA